MKTTEQYFPVVLFLMLYKLALTFVSVDEIQKCSIQMQDIEQYSPEVVFIMLYDVALNLFDSVDEILKCGDQSNEGLLGVLYLFI